MLLITGSKYAFIVPYNICGFPAESPNDNGEVNVFCINWEYEYLNTPEGRVIEDNGIPESDQWTNSSPSLSRE